MSKEDEKKGRVQLTREEFNILLNIMWKDVKKLEPNVPDNCSRYNLYYKLTRAFIRMEASRRDLDEVRRESG